jgi:hypothetical protein
VGVGFLGFLEIIGEGGRRRRDVERTVTSGEEEEGLAWEYTWEARTLLSFFLRLSHFKFKSFFLSTLL